MEFSGEPVKLPRPMLVTGLREFPLEVCPVRDPKWRRMFYKNLPVFKYIYLIYLEE